MFAPDPSRVEPIISPSSSPSPSPESRRWRWVGGICALLVAGVGGIVWLRGRTSSDNLPLGSPPVMDARRSPGVEEQGASSPVEMQYAPDQDGDGLADDEERERGTKVEESDTDGDGVSDFEEVYLRKTDPLSSTPSQIPPVPAQP